MSFTNTDINDSLTLAGITGPQTINNVAATSPVIDMSQYDRVMFVLCLGDMAAETIDFNVKSSAVVGMTSPTTVKSITQLAASASANDNKQVIIELQADDIADGQRYVQATAVTGGATGGMGVIQVWGQARYSKKAQPASVLQIIT